MSLIITPDEIARSIRISGQTGLLSFAGLTSTDRIKTLRDAADTVLELGGSYTPTGTWTNLTMVTPALGTPASGVLTSCTGTADGLTAGDVTRGHAVYAGASPPTVDVGVFTIAKTGINMKAAGTTTVFTVPASRTFVCFGAFLVVTAVTSGGAGVQVFQIKASTGPVVMTQAVSSASATPIVGNVYYQNVVPGASPFFPAPAADNVTIVVSTSHAGSTAVTGTCFIQGWYSS